MSALVIAVAACALLAFLVVLAMTRAVPIAVCFALFAAALPWSAVQWQAGRRRAVLMEVWPDAVDHLRSAVRSGLSLPEAIIQLGTSGPSELREPFSEFGRDYRAGLSQQQALSRLKERLADPVGDRLVVALQITREVGGSELGKMLTTLSEFLRQNSRMRSELKARQSWTVNGAKLAVAAPWIVVLLLGTQPAAAEAYQNARGMMVLAMGLVISVVCYRLMLRIGRLPQEVRVLA
ncbi:hypothetical protein GCM10009771_04700 [Nesterenkonia flava]